MVSLALIAAIADLALTLYRRSRPKPSPASEIRTIYAALCKRAGWTGLGPDPTLTPREYIASLGRVFEGQGNWSVGSSRYLEEIGLAYEVASYALGSIPEGLWYRARTAWHRLKPKLWRVLILAKLGRLPIREIMHGRTMHRPNP